MSENMTRVLGYFNPQKYPIFVEISEINLKAELAPNAFVRDRQGKYINDPVFEPYCHSKGLSRSTSDKLVPINYVPRFIKSERPVAAVTQATGFVRERGGKTVPTYAPRTATPEAPAMNKRPITGMSMEAARRAGLVGKPRLVAEDFGAPEGTGAPASSAELPDIKYSIESPPRNPAARPNSNITPQVAQAKIQEALASGPEEAPEEVPALPTAPVPLKAPDAPAPPEALPVKPISAKTKVKVAVAPARARRVATPVPVEPVKIEPAAEAEEEQAEPSAEQEEVFTGSGVVQPINDEPLPAPTLEAPASDDDGKRFVCGADGRAFKFRSELERHVDRNFADMKDELMQPYPP